MLLGFNPQFKAAILAGSKIHTIRRGQRFKAGQKLHMATGARTANYEQFNKDREDLSTCKRAQRIDIRHTREGMMVQVDGRFLNAIEIHNLSMNDGFPSRKEFEKFFECDLVNGQIIHWTNFKY